MFADFHGLICNTSFSTTMLSWPSIQLFVKLT